MIDFYGSGFDVAERMGLREALSARHYDIPSLDFVDGRGRRQAGLNVEKFRKALGFRHYNFMRGDLEEVLFDAVRNDVRIRFGTTVDAVRNETGHVKVRFSDGSEKEFDLVIGADGIHSRIRELLWGREDQYLRFLGFYVGCSVVENFLGKDRFFQGHLEPGLQASVYSIRDNRLATFFAFESQKLENTDGTDAKLSAMENAFGDAGWLVPDLLQKSRNGPGVFLDAVSQIELDTWHKSRVVLVGDSCQCLTLLAGQGASMAMAGAYLLADEIGTKGMGEDAFEAYSSRLKPEIRERQKSARGLARSFVPHSRFNVLMTILAFRMAFLPGFQKLFQREIGAKSILA